MHQGKSSNRQHQHPNENHSNRYKNMWVDPMRMLAESDLVEAAVKQLSSWQITAKSLLYCMQ
jgi:hypothetical protein